jgi:hypothetical protein
MSGGDLTWRLWFLRAGGLTTLFRHVRASPMSDPTSQPPVKPLAIAKAATDAFLALPKDAISAECQEATYAIAPLVDAARDAPLPLSRAAAFSVLLELAGLPDGQPMHRLAMGEAGLVGVLVTHYIEFGLDTSRDFAMLVAQLVHKLLESGVAAAQDLKREILAPEIVRTITALVFLLVRLSNLFLNSKHSACKTSSNLSSSACGRSCAYFTALFCSRWTGWSRGGGSNGSPAEVGLTVLIERR